MALPVVPGSSLACAWALSCAWGSSDRFWLGSATCSFRCLLEFLLHPFLPEPLLDTDSKPICMSDSDLLWHLDLTVRDLCRLVESLSTRVANLEHRTRAPVGFWEVVAEEAPFGIQHSIPQDHFLCSEWGPPEVPDSFLDFAKGKLVDYPGSRHRVIRAFEAGFWANIAVATHTAYRFAEDIPLEEKQWVVYRAPGLVRPFRVQDRLELDRLLSLPGPFGSPIVQGFATELEVKIFCAGGGRVVPALLQWRSLQ